MDNEKNYFVEEAIKALNHNDNVFLSYYDNDGEKKTLTGESILKVVRMLLREIESLEAKQKIHLDMLKNQRESFVKFCIDFEREVELSEDVGLSCGEEVLKIFTKLQEKIIWRGEKPCNLEIADEVINRIDERLYQLQRIYMFVLKDDINDEEALQNFGIIHNIHNTIILPIAEEYGVTIKEHKQ